MSRLFKLLLPIIGGLLLVVPTVARHYLYYGDLDFEARDYETPEIAPFDASNVSPTAPDYEAFVDEPTVGEGRILFDLTHNNNLELNDLTILQTRLESRGATVVPIEGEALLTDHLRGATGVVIIAPTTLYSPDEVAALEAFVEDGGRLLLAADPTRQVPPEDEEFLSLFDIFFPQSAVPAINSIAKPFEITFFDDYLYNLQENASNYRNVILSDLLPDHPLTADVDSVVMFAAHSLAGDGLAVVKGNQQTTSPLRTGESDLAAALLTSDERVLALGDVTLLTPPYHTVADNNQFLSRIADWLAVDDRVRELDDFPYLFESPTVNLVQISQDFLNTQLIAQVGTLGQTFDEANLDLTLSSPQAAIENDILYVGTFEDTALIEPYLMEAGIVITVEEPIVPTETVATDEAEATDETSAETPTSEAEIDLEAVVEEATQRALEQITPSQSIVFTDDLDIESPVLTETDTLTETVEESLDEFDEMNEFDEMDEFSETDEVEEPQTRVILEIDRFGKLGAAGTSLFIVDRSETGNVVVIALAEDDEATVTALNKLGSADFSGCTQNGNLTLCSTGETQDEFTSDPSDDIAPTETTTSTLASIFVMSDDDGPEGNRTGAADWETYLSSDYEVVVWSNADDGIPEAEIVEGYDLYIIDSGDYAADPNDFETLFAFATVDEDASVMFIGAQPLPAPMDEANQQLLDDLIVTDNTHPIAADLTAGEIILLDPSESGVAPVVIPNPEELYDDASIIFSRGPDSPESGSPVVIAAEDDSTGARIVLATFAFYRLPETVREGFAVNSVAWLLGE